MICLLFFYDIFFTHIDVINIKINIKILVQIRFRRVTCVIPIFVVSRLSIIVKRKELGVKRESVKSKTKELEVYRSDSRIRR